MNTPRMMTMSVEDNRQLMRIVERARDLYKACPNDDRCIYAKIELKRELDIIGLGNGLDENN